MCHLQASTDSDHTFLGYGCSLTWYFHHTGCPKFELWITVSLHPKKERGPSRIQKQQNIDRKSFRVLHHHPQVKITCPLGIPKIPSMFPKLLTPCTPTCAIATNTYMTHAVPEGAHRGKAPRRFSDTQRINLTCKVSQKKWYNKICVSFSGPSKFLSIHRQAA